MGLQCKRNSSRKNAYLIENFNNTFIVYIFRPSLLWKIVNHENEFSKVYFNSTPYSIRSYSVSFLRIEEPSTSMSFEKLFNRAPRTSKTFIVYIFRPSLLWKIVNHENEFSKVYFNSTPYSIRSYSVSFLRIEEPSTSMSFEKLFNRAPRTSKTWRKSRRIPSSSY